MDASRLRAFIANLVDRTAGTGTARSSCKDSLPGDTERKSSREGALQPPPPAALWDGTVDATQGTRLTRISQSTRRQQLPASHSARSSGKHPQRKPWIVSSGIPFKNEKRKTGGPSLLIWGGRSLDG